MPKSIKDLSKNYLTDPAHVSVTPAATTAERIEQYLFMVQQDEKQALLEMILKGRHDVPGKQERILVFTRTKHGADRVVKKLRQAGIESNAIHGNKSQPQRQRALDEFKRAKTPILIATDVAARGIDIPGVSHVINYELPNVPEQYVHRIGRTARAGKDGVAIAFCAEDERAYLKDIQKNTDAEFDRLPLPENFRAVVEGVGPTKREQKQRGPRIKPKPKAKKGGAPRGKPQAAGGPVENPVKREGKPQGKPKQKHSARKGRPGGRPGGGRPQGSARGSGQGGGGRPMRRKRSGGGGQRRG